MGNYTNKEISWLSFNARVLQEAADPQVPLIERIKFLGIFSSNLDEFFRVRVATLKRLAQLGKKSRKIIGSDAKEILKKIQDIVIKQQQEFESIYQSILKELEKEKIFIINEKQLNPEQSQFIQSYFQEKVRPKLVPIMIDQESKFPDLKDHAIYLAICLTKKSPSKIRINSLIEVPTDVLPRFLILPHRGENRYIILLDDIIRFGLKDIFSVLNIDEFEAFTVKLTRDAELDIEDDLSESYIRKVSKSLKHRKEGNPVRFIYDAKLPKSLLNYFAKQLQLNKEDVFIPGAKYHNFRDFMNFPDFNNPDFRYEPFEVLPHKDINRTKSLLGTIEEKDLLIHFCYQSFNYVIDLLREAAIDPSIRSIKITIYRAGKNSNVINALINAAKNGKRVVVVLELQARFDEEANISWGTKLLDEGVKVIYGVPGLKVHSKLCLITRIKNNITERFAAVGTGNFNEDTARIYTDHLLLTTNKKITNEVFKAFNYFSVNDRKDNVYHLVLSPFFLRNKITLMIDNEIRNAKSGKKAYIHIKLNNLTDKDIIDQLYEASNAGVKIKLLVRGMMSLVPGIPGQSDNIKAIAIVDRFLEHSRFYKFCNGGNEEIYISSADLMPRNLDHRIEVTCPVFDKTIKEEIKTIFDIQWKDNVKARVLDEDQSNQFVKTGDTKLQSQIEVYNYIKSINNVS